MVHIIFPENVFRNLPRRANKRKVSVKNLSKLFGSCSGVIECVSKAIGKKLWRSAWLLIENIIGLLLNVHFGNRGKISKV